MKSTVAICCIVFLLLFSFCLADVNYSANERYDFGDYWNNFSLENSKEYLKEINEIAELEILSNIRQENGEINGTYSIVADISGVTNGRIEIWEGGYFLIESDIEDWKNPIIWELYIRTAERYITNDQNIAIDLVVDMYDDFENEYMQNIGTSGTYVERRDGIGRYMMAFKGDRGAKFILFMGELQ